MLTPPIALLRDRLECSRHHSNICVHGCGGLALTRFVAYPVDQRESGDNDLVMPESVYPSQHI